MSHHLFLQTVSKLKNLVIKPPHEYKGPISALAPVQGHLVVAIGVFFVQLTFVLDPFVIGLN